MDGGKLNGEQNQLRSLVMDGAQGKLMVNKICGVTRNGRYIGKLQGE